MYVPTRAVICIGMYVHAYMVCIRREICVVHAGFPMPLQHALRRIIILRQRRCPCRGSVTPVDDEPSAQNRPRSRTSSFEEGNHFAEWRLPTTKSSRGTQKHCHGTLNGDGPRIGVDGGRVEGVFWSHRLSLETLATTASAHIHTQVNVCCVGPRK